MNPFAQVPPPALGNSFVASGNYSGLIPPPGLPPGMGQVNANSLQQAPSGALDPTLDFLLSNSAMQQTSTGGMNLTGLPATLPPQDPSESILNFLFDSNHDASENRQPLYPGQQQPPTKNPFAT